MLLYFSFCELETEKNGAPEVMFFTGSSTMLAQSKGEMTYVSGIFGSCHYFPSAV
jgi:hypothetical protein